MDLTRKSEIKNLLEEYNAKPEKYLGQHFILSKKALNLMIATAEIEENDTIIEIGPGLGTLTQELSKTGAKIIAIEKDSLMILILKETLSGYKNVKIIQADARQLSPDLLTSDVNKIGDKMRISVGGDRYKIVANLPYNIATFLIRSWLESKNPPKIMVLMIQKEVAQRICPPSLKLRRAGAKSLKLNLLSTSVQFYADAKIIGYVPKESFYPQPKVDAAIIKIVPKKKPSAKAAKRFFWVVKAGFSSPRKQLAGNLSKNLKISKEEIISVFKSLDIPRQIRAENLSLSQWQNLAFRLIHN